jgi:glycosyltransferase involved in cell wall biosynthesis
MTCCDLGRYLEEAVQSVLGQTLQDFEIIIVDDGSTDRETRDLLASYERPRTRVIRTENRGLPAARNRAIRESSGDFVCALDADDLLEPTWFEEAIEILDGDPTVSFVSHWVRSFGDERYDWTPDRCDLAALLDMNTINGAAMVRRLVLLEEGLYDETMRHGGEDWELWIRLLERGHRGVIVPRLLFRYRRRPDSMSRAMSHLDLAHSLVQRHGPSYQRHLDELLQRRDLAVCDLRRGIDALEREHRSWFVPELQRRRAEVELLRGKAAELQRRRAEQERAQRALAEAEQEARSLRDAAAQLRGELTVLRGEAAAQRSAADQLRGELAAQCSAADQLRAENDRQRGELERRREERDRSQHALAEAQREVERLCRERVGLTAALGDARREVEALHGSWSWRLTTPLRRTLDLYRRLRGPR